MESQWVRCASVRCLPCGTGPSGQGRSTGLTVPPVYIPGELALGVVENAVFHDQPQRVWLNQQERHCERVTTSYRSHYLLELRSGAGILLDHVCGDPGPHFLALTVAYVHVRPRLPRIASCVDSVEVGVVTQRSKDMFVEFLDARNAC